MRSDIIKMYKDAHTWVGIISGLALFIAFYAGAITMFEEPLQHWASPPTPFGEFTTLENTPELIRKVQEAHPEARSNYQIVLQPSAMYPARMNWQLPLAGADEHDTPDLRHANLDANGSLQIAEAEDSAVAQLIDTLHRQIGLPFEHEISMPVMGAIALLYGIALVSGIIILLPTLVKDLFAFRQGKNLKRMWLDFHNLLGIFSLPFHLIMVLTAVPFAFHDQFYDAQQALLYAGGQDFSNPPRAQVASTEDSAANRESLPPAILLARLKEQAPGFEPTLLSYQVAPQQGPALRVWGNDRRYGMRSKEGGVAGVDPYTGTIIATDYMPGLQNAWGATITSIFTLHFGSFGGYTIRWSYFFLGIGGALLFYTGNLLWLERRRKKLRNNQSTQTIRQTRSSRIMGALTIGVSLGCVAGISLTIAAAKILPSVVDNVASAHTVVYYFTFLAAIGWALLRDVAHGSVELLVATAVATMMIPLASILSYVIPGLGWNYQDQTILVDLVAVLGAAVLFILAFKTAKRIHHAPADSIWYSDKNTLAWKNKNPDTLFQ